MPLRYIASVAQPTEQSCTHSIRPPFRSKGIKGFWWSYPNIYDLVERELKIDKPFTDWTRSSFFSPDGLQVAASCFLSIVFPFVVARNVPLTCSGR